MENVWYNYPINPVSEELRVYFLATLGYHLQSTIKHCLKERRNDFIEMLLHHCLTIALYTGSYMVNFLPIGLIIVFCLDIADFWTHISKGFVDLIFKKTLHVIGVFLWCSWVYTRIVCFPIIVYYGAYVGPR